MSTRHRIARLADVLAPADGGLRAAVERLVAADGVDPDRFRAETERILASGAGGVPFDPDRMIADVAAFHGIAPGWLAAEVGRVMAEVGR